MQQSPLTFEEIDPDELLGDSKENYPSVHSYDLYNQSMHPDFADYVQPRKKNSFCFDDEPLSLPTNTRTTSKTSQSSVEQQKKVPQTLSKRTSSDSDHIPTKQEIALFDQSIYSDRIGNPLPPPPRPSGKYEEVASYNQSYYMKPVIEPTSIRQPLAKRQKTSQSTCRELQVIFRVTSYFLEKGSVSVQVDKESLQDLYDQFFKRELFVPLFNINLHEEWASSGEKNLYDSHFQPHRLFRTYLIRYANFISGKFSSALTEILPAILEVQQGRGRKREQATSIASIFAFDWTSLIQTFKQFMGASKTQVLRKTLLAKAKSIREAIKICEQTSLQKELACLLESQEEIWGDLGEVELLLSFQSTQEYCTRKIESSSEPKFKQIWLKYRESIRQDRKHHLVTHLSRLPI